MSILFCGDTFSFARDGTDPFGYVRDMFRSAVVVANLEASVDATRESGPDRIVLSVGDQALANLAPHIRYVSVVNNHSADGDINALVRRLRARGVSVLGPANPSLQPISVNDVHVDVMSAYFRLPRLGLSYRGRVSTRLLHLLRHSNARRKVVFVHWGYEHTIIPAPFQRQLAKRLVDAGADLVVGHHPHVAQGFEQYRGSSIFYSLGNFNFWQFDRTPGARNRWGYVVDYQPSTGDWKCIPYLINDNYQPYFPDVANRSQLLSEIRSLSDRLVSISSRSWFTEHYAKWYVRELEAWKRDLSSDLRVTRGAQWLAWFLLPIQFRFYSEYALTCIRGRSRCRGHS